MHSHTRVIRYRNEWTRFGFGLQECMCVSNLTERQSCRRWCVCTRRQLDIPADSTELFKAVQLSGRCVGACVCFSTLLSYHHLFMSLKVGCVTLGRNCSLSHDMKARVRLWNAGMSQKIMTPGLLFMVHVGIRLHLKMFIWKSLEWGSRLFNKTFSKCF